MENVKYEILKDEPVKLFGRTLYKIVARKSFYAGLGFTVSELCGTRIGAPVPEGEIGGFVESEANLSQDGACWIGKGAAVFGKAVVTDNALVTGIHRCVPTVTVRDCARIYGNANVCDFAQIRDSAQIGGCSVIRQYARIEDASIVIDADVGGYVCIYNNIFLKGADKILDYNAAPQRISTKIDLERALISVEDARLKSLRSSSYRSNYKAEETGNGCC